jgi:hypothetical protein
MYESQITLAKASVLSEGFHTRRRWKCSRVHKEMAREGL